MSLVHIQPYILEEGEGNRRRPWGEASPAACRRPMAAELLPGLRAPTRSCSPADGAPRRPGHGSQRPWRPVSAASAAPAARCCNEVKGRHGGDEVHPPRWPQPALRWLVATRPHTPAGRGHSSRRRRPLAAELGQRDGRGGAVEAEEGDSGGSLGGGRLQWGWPWGSSSPMAGVLLLRAVDTCCCCSREADGDDLGVEE